MEIELEPKFGNASRSASRDSIQNRHFRSPSTANRSSRIAGCLLRGGAGQRHVATNPTMGTGIATTTSIQTYDTTKPVMMVINPYGRAGRASSSTTCA
jgi:hypothetical protein